ncbi:glycosyltransferase family A protein [Amycolatopsis sp. NPDC051373]|uniref:glycosyltransferase family 2 protein n=1 Tax=Amycolatopsis sp. NPDC051373 TaxID=3155801 RepID=UPI00344DD614
MSVNLIDVTMDVTAVVCTIPPRAKRLRAALASIAMQTVQPAGIVVEYDHHRTGAAATKNRALARVSTPWAAWLDDDDVWFPNHLDVCVLAAHESGADVVYPWPQMQGAPDLRPDRFGQPFDPVALRRENYIPTTALFRADLAREVGGFQCVPGTSYDDWGLWLAMLDAGATFHHVPVKTWEYRHAGQNTSGRPDAW